MYSGNKYDPTKEGSSGWEVPYTDEKTVEDCLKVWKHSTNETLFDPVSCNRGKEFGLVITWNKLIDEDLFACLRTATPL